MVPMKLPQAMVVDARRCLLQRVALWIAIAGFALACQATHARENVDLLVAKGTLIDPASSSSGRIADIAIDDGVILAVGEGVRTKYDASQTVDATGQYVIPGLADMHTHFGTGVKPADEDDTTPVLARLCKLLRWALVQLDDLHPSVLRASFLAVVGCGRRHHADTAATHAFCIDAMIASQRFNHRIGATS